MKILHLCLSAFFIDNYSYQENILPKYHAKQGHEVTVIASLFTFNEEGKGTYLSSPSKYRDKNGFDVIRLQYRKPYKWNRLFRHYVGLKKEINNIQPDIIFMHNACFGDTPIIKHYLKNHPKVMLFVDNHADWINSAKNWMSRNILHPIIWRYYTKILEPYMVKCFGVTPMRCRFLKEMYHIKPSIIEYLPLGVDDDLIPSDREIIRNEVRNELGIGKTDFLIITGGKIDKLKNTHVIIDALKLLNDKRVHLVICGVLTPEMDFLQKIIDANSNIHYLGWCKSDRVMNCMVASDLACFPGTHSTLWEQSIGVGLPAIFKRWPEMEHVNVNGNCLFVKGDDSMELFNVILSMVFTDKYKQLLYLAGEASHSFLYSKIAKKAISF